MTEPNTCNFINHKLLTTVLMHFIQKEQPTKNAKIKTNKKTSSNNKKNKL